MVLLRGFWRFVLSHFNTATFLAAVHGQFRMKAQLRNGANAAHFAMAARTWSEIFVHKKLPTMTSIHGHVTNTAAIFADVQSATGVFFRI